MYPVNTNKLTVTSKFGPRTYTYQGKQVSDYGFAEGVIYEKQ